MPEVMMAILIQRYDKTSFHFTDCQLPHFMIILKWGFMDAGTGSRGHHGRRDDLALKWLNI